MINFHLYRSANDKYLTYVLAFYEQSFPVDERRRIAKMLELIENEPRFHAHALFNDGELIGFFNYWDLDEFLYVEHFAIDPMKRGKNLGSEVLKSFVEQAGKPVILEVERPEDPIKERRIAFYQRHGFKLSQKPYMQPAYEEGQRSVPMYLMEYGGNLLENNFGLVKHKIYSVVYGVNEE